MKTKRQVVVKKSKLKKDKIDKAKGLSTTEKLVAAMNQEQKLKIGTPIVREFEEWE